MNDFKDKNDKTIYKRINSEGYEISSNAFIQCSKIKNHIYKKNKNKIQPTKKLLLMGFVC